MEEKAACRIQPNVRSIILSLVSSLTSSSRTGAGRECMLRLLIPSTSGYVIHSERNDICLSHNH